MKSIVTFLALFVMSCASGRELVRLDVSSEGAIDATTNLNAYGIVTTGNGYVMFTTAQPPFFPVYPTVTFDHPIVLLGTLDGKLSWKGERGDVIPAEFVPIAGALWTPIRIGELGLVFAPPDTETN